MQTSARNNYLETEVYTATPQKLQLMLVEAAIRNVYKAKRLWEEEEVDGAFEAMVRSQDIVAEILSSLDLDGTPEIAKRLASIYIFIFRQLAEANMLRDVAKADEALKVLETERKNWKMVCEKFGSTLTEAKAKDGGVPEAARGFDSSRLDLSTRKVEKDLSSASNDVAPKEKGKGKKASGEGKPAKKGAKGGTPPLESTDAPTSGFSLEA
jgi:flagellar protein FliS